MCVGTNVCAVLRHTVQWCLCAFYCVCVLRCHLSPGFLIWSPLVKRGLLWFYGYRENDCIYLLYNQERDGLQREKIEVGSANKPCKRGTTTQGLLINGAHPEAGSLIKN